MNSRPGINIVGYASAYMGLGAVARELAKALQARGHPVAVHDLDAGAGRSGSDHSLRALFVPNIADLPHGLTLWVIGADSLPYVARRICQDARAPTSAERGIRLVGTPRCASDLLGGSHGRRRAGDG